MSMSVGELLNNTEDETVHPGTVGEHAVVYGSEQDMKDAEAALVSDPLRKFMKGIGKVALLKAEDEVRLAQDMEAGIYAQHLLEEENPETDSDRFEDLSEIARDGL